VKLSTNISLKDRNFIETFLHPVAFFEFIHDAPPRQFQREVLLDDAQLLQLDCARGVGKTFTLIPDIIRTILLNPGKTGLVTTPYNAHIVPLWDTLVSKIYSKMNMEDSLIRSSRSPDYLMTFKNGFTLNGRIASASAGRSLLGLHLDYVWADEAQLYFPAETAQLQGCLNSGCKIKLAGVPNGIRKSYLYKSTQGDSFHHYTVNKFSDPTYTKEDDDRMAIVLGGRTSQAYSNLILAEWGLPQAVAFPERWWGTCIEPAPSYKIYNYVDKEIFNRPDDLYYPEFNVENARITADIGYNPDPTVIGVHCKIDGVWHLTSKFVLNMVDPVEQAKFMHFLAGFYKISAISLDVGNIGKAVYLELLKLKSDYRVIAVNFGGAVIIGKDADGKEMKARIKYYSTVLLNNMFKKKLLLLPDDEVLQDELKGATQSITPAGHQVYSGIDHNTDMLRILAITDLLEVGGVGMSDVDVIFSDF